MRFVIVILYALSAVACRRPPTDPVPADAAPLPVPDAASGAPDAGPAPDGSVSQCTALPDLTCEGVALLAARDGELWQPDKDGALEEVRAEVAPALAASGGALCGQATPSGAVHYLGDDSQVHQVFRLRLPNRVAGEQLFDPEGVECTTRQDFVRKGAPTIRLRTRRAQKTFSVQVIP